MHVVAAYVTTVTEPRFDARFTAAPFWRTQLVGMAADPEGELMPYSYVPQIRPMVID
jgi:hypothetical protein